MVVVSFEKLTDILLENRTKEEIVSAVLNMDVYYAKTSRLELINRGEDREYVYNK